MGLKNSPPSTHSVVKATAPFMGLDPKMPTWNEPLFNTTRAGCCWEVYNVKERGDFPPDGMNITVRVVADPDPDPDADADAAGAGAGAAAGAGVAAGVAAAAALSIDFPDWEIQEKPTCPYSPDYTLESSTRPTEKGGQEQEVHLDIYFESPDI